MAEIRFFEKTGCTGNARQKAILSSAGHIITTENLLLYPFTADELRSYFSTLPVALWFNPSSPRVVSGDIDINSMNEVQALTAMLEDRLLIRRPLMEIDTIRITGFNIDALEQMGVTCSANPRLELLNGQDLEECPGHALGLKCNEPRVDPENFL